MSIDAVVGPVQPEGNLVALVQDGALRHEADLGGGSTQVQSTNQHPLFRQNPLSRGILTTEGMLSSGQPLVPAAGQRAAGTGLSDQPLTLGLPVHLEEQSQDIVDSDPTKGTFILPSQDLGTPKIHRRLA